MPTKADRAASTAAARAVARTARAARAPHANPEKQTEGLATGAATPTARHRTLGAKSRARSAGLDPMQTLGWIG